MNKKMKNWIEISVSRGSFGIATNNILLSFIIDFDCSINFKFQASRVAESVCACACARIHARCGSGHRARQCMGQGLTSDVLVFDCIDVMLTISILELFGKINWRMNADQILLLSVSFPFTVRWMCARLESLALHELMRWNRRVKIKTACQAIEDRQLHVIQLIIIRRVCRNGFSLLSDIHSVSRTDVNWNWLARRRDAHTHTPINRIDLIVKREYAIHNFHNWYRRLL